MAPKSTAEMRGELCKQSDDDQKLRLSQNSPDSKHKTGIHSNPSRARRGTVKLLHFRESMSKISIHFNAVRLHFLLAALEAQLLSKYNINRVDFVLLEQLVLVQQPYKAGMPWQFAGSFYYATTVLTTIGKQECKRLKSRNTVGTAYG